MKAKFIRVSQKEKEQIESSGTDEHRAILGPKLIAIGEQFDNVIYRPEKPGFFSIWPKHVLIK